MTLNHFIYKVAKPFGGLQIARFLARNHPRILMYHRISPDGSPGTISVDQFRKQMKLIKRSFNPISLSKLIELHEQGITPKHAVAVTFDDGYSDFADYAFPILLEEKIPATLFITTGFVNGDVWLWPDQVKYVIESTEMRHPLLIPGLKGLLNVHDHPSKSWHQICDYCMTIEDHKKLELIKNIYSELKVELPDKPPSRYRPLNWKQLKEMVDQGLDVQSHSVSHPILTKVTVDQLDMEVALSRAHIYKNLGIDSQGFCYPNGQESDFNQVVIDALNKSGYKYGVTAYSDKSPIDKLWEIKRYPASVRYKDFENMVFGLVFLKFVFRYK